MSISIRVEVDGQHITPQALAVSHLGEKQRRVLGQLVDTLYFNLCDMQCPNHSLSPTITVVAPTNGRSGFRLAGCCSELVRLTRQELHSLWSGSDNLKAGNWLSLTILAAEATLGIDGTLITDQWVLGRRDPESDDRPEIDLELYEAFEKGVSRRHAALIWQQGMFYVMDLGSANKSYLNDERLLPYEVHRLRHSDTLRLAKLDIHISLL